MAGAEGLGECLGGLQPPRGGGGTEAGDADLRHRVGHAGLDRRIRADDHQVRLDFAGQGGLAGHIDGADRAHLAQLRHAGISGGRDQAREQWRLGDLPGQRVFASARSDQEHLHAPSSGREAGFGQAPGVSEALIALCYA